MLYWKFTLFIANPTVKPDLVEVMKLFVSLVFGYIKLPLFEKKMIFFLPDGITSYTSKYMKYKLLLVSIILAANKDNTERGLLLSYRDIKQKSPPHPRPAGVPPQTPYL